MIKTQNSVFGGLRKSVMDGSKDGQIYGWTDPFVEMHLKKLGIKKSATKKL